MMWHDGATICNNSHVLFTCCEAYDKAIHLTDKEALQKYGRKVDVQETIEKPEIYMLARCPGTTELTAYSSTRMYDIMELELPIMFDNGVEVYDTVRFFKGDGPSCQFESGQQKGGNYFCWACGIPSYRVKEYIHASYRKNLSIHDRQEKVLISAVSRRRSEQGFTKLYEKLTRAEIADELDDREIKWKASDTSADLLKLLKTNMHGIQRVPSLLFNSPNGDINNMHLMHYEILPCEPLHDIENHIKNLFEEIPHHMGNDKKMINDFLISVFNGKESKRGCDYRECLIKVFCYFKEKYPENCITEVLYTLCEIQRSLYQQESQRTVASVLHLYIQTFLHVIMIKIAFGNNIKSMTERKFYGKYYHALTSHVCHQYRIVDGRSSNAENDERCFHTIKVVSNDTSNHSADNIISNAFIRGQVRKEFCDDDTIVRTEAAITKMYKNISVGVNNSIISFEIIEKYPWEYQALLEKISDYLKEGVFWREVGDGIEFMDIDKVESKLYPHHFRSSNISIELDNLQNCWEDVCLNNPDKFIPAFRIKVEDNLGRTYIKILNTLNHNKENVMEHSCLQSVGNEELSESSMSSVVINPELSNVNSTPKCVHNSTLDQTSILHPLGYEELQESCTTDLNESCNTGFVDFVTSTPKCTQQPRKLRLRTSIYDSKINESNSSYSTEALSVGNKTLQPSYKDCERGNSDTQENVIQSSYEDCEIVNSDTQENVIQVMLAEPVLTRDDEIIMQLIDVLGETELVQEYKTTKRKADKYPNEDMYWDDLRTVLAKLEVKLKLSHERFNEEIKDIQYKRLKNNYISLSLLPSEGDEKLRLDEITGKLKSITRLNAVFNLTAKS